MNFLESFLQKNARPFLISPEGIYYHVEKQGEGRKPLAGEYVKVNYTGKFLNGQMFDTSEGRAPFVFKLGQGSVIKGWDLGLSLFKEGSKGILYLSPEFAYGEQGAGGVIPPNATLMFEIELLEILDEAGYQAHEAAKMEEQKRMMQAYVEKQMAEEMPKIMAYAEQEGLELQRTTSGLHYVMETEGTGAQAEAGKTVSVHYTGRLLDGGKFDSSYDRNQPIAFPLGGGRVIAGWDEGIALFKVGGKGKLVIPSYLGYGPQNMGSIPPNSVLAFDIELVKVE